MQRVTNTERTVTYYSTSFNFLVAFSTELQQLKSSWDLSCARIRETEEKVAFKDKQIEAMLQQIPILETQATELSNVVSINQNITQKRTLHPVKSDHCILLQQFSNNFKTY